MLYTPDFEINLMTDNENLLSKIDTSMIKHAVLADDGVKNSLSQKTEVMLICRKVWEFDQYDHWTKKGIACYNVIVPYDTVIDNNISKEQITIVCSNLVKDCLLQWAEKKRKKPARARATARV
jgi:hypothetical protein